MQTLLKGYFFLAHLRFDPLARQCFTNHNPKVLAVEWAASVSIQVGTIGASVCIAYGMLK